MGKVTISTSTLHQAIVDNESQLRLVLANSLRRRIENNVDPKLPVRQNRRTAYRKLVSAFALIIGTEAMVVTRDVLQLSDQEAEKVRHWAIEALVKSAKASRRFKR